METKSSCLGADACSQTTHTSSTHCLPVTSAVTFANGLDPDQARQNVGPDLEPSCLLSDCIPERNF